MAELSSKRRKQLPASKFALPEKRAYPIMDRAHAANAKSRAAQQVNAGNLSPAAAARIRSKANKVLGK